MRFINKLQLNRFDDLAIATMGVYLTMLLLTSLVSHFLGATIFSPALLWFLANGFITMRAARYQNISLDWRQRLIFLSAISIGFVLSNAVALSLFAVEQPTNPLLSYFVMYLAAIIVGLAGMAFFAYLEKRSRPVTKKPSGKQTKKVKPRRVKRSKKLRRAL